MATYYVITNAEGQDTYHCLVCQQHGTEHHSSNLELFTQHQHQRHAGEMSEGEAPAEEGQEADAPSSPAREPRCTVARGGRRWPEETDTPEAPWRRPDW